MRKIHVGILISYDYHFAPTAIAQIYERADRITLAVDRERRTWTGGEFEIDPAFFDQIRENDPEGKIDVLEGDFFDATLTPMENEIRERQMLLQHMDTGERKWFLQVDADEYFVDFGRFVDYLHAAERRFGGRILVHGRWVTLFRRDAEGFFYIESGRPEYVPLAVNYPRYTGCRHNFLPSVANIYSNHVVLHQSWARTDDEVWQKLSNWGHKNDFDIGAYFDFWRGVSRDNAHEVRNFHPVDRDNYWARLRFVAGDVGDIIAELRKGYDPQKAPGRVEWVKAKINGLRRWKR